VPSTLLSGTPSNVSSVPISTGIDPACFLHKRFQLRRRHLATGGIPQFPRPFADRFAVGVVVTSAADDGAKWIRFLVEGQLSKFKCVPQKLLGLSSHFVMLDDSEHGFQISINGIASAVCLKLVPRVNDLFESSPSTGFRGILSVRVARSTLGHASQHCAEPERLLCRWRRSLPPLPSN
jgi:hypothetical protein